MNYFRVGVGLYVLGVSPRILLLSLKGGLEHVRLYINVGNEDENANKLSPSSRRYLYQDVVPLNVTFSSHSQII